MDSRTFGEVRPYDFRVRAYMRAEVETKRQTDKQTTHTHHNISQPSCGRGSLMKQTSWWFVDCKSFITTM